MILILHILENLFILCFAPLQECFDRSNAFILHIEGFCFVSSEARSLVFLFATLVFFYHLKESSDIWDFVPGE